MHYNLLCLILLMSMHLVAQDQPAWVRAADAYSEGRFQDAIDQYEELLSQGFDNSELQYNLGNAYYQSGDIAHAVLHYERALRYQPGDPEIINNLVLVNRGRQNAVIPVSRFFLYRWIRSVASVLTPHAWGLLSLVLVWSAIGAFAYIIWYPAGRPVKRVAVVIAVCALAAIAFGAVRLHDLRSDDFAIIMLPHVNVHVAPDAESKVALDIGVGEKVRILDSLDGFFKVRLPNYEEGWVDEKTLERI